MTVFGVPFDSPEAEYGIAIASVARTRTAEEWVAALGAAGVRAVPVAKRFEIDNPYLVGFGWPVVIEDRDLGRLAVSREFGALASVKATIHR